MGDILLRIAGSQAIDGNTAKVDLVTRGTVEEQDGQYTIEYSDGSDDGETVIQVADDVVTIHRPDSMIDRLVLEKEKPYFAECMTPFGDFGINIYTTLIDTRLAKESGHIELEYVLEVGGSQGVNRLNLSYEGK